MIEITLTAPPVPKPAEAAPPPPAPVQPPQPPKPVEPPKPKKPPPPKPVPKPKPVQKPKPAEAVKPEEKPVPVAKSEPVAETGPEPAAEARPAAPVAARSNAAADSFEEAKAHAAYLHNPKPDYPALARQRQWEGKVLLKVRVLASGRPGEVSVQQSSGHEALDEAALNVVQRWNFVPAKRGGTPVDSWVSVPIVFKLDR